MTFSSSRPLKSVVVAAVAVASLSRGQVDAAAFVAPTLPPSTSRTETTRAALFLLPGVGGTTTRSARWTAARTNKKPAAVATTSTTATALAAASTDATTTSGGGAVVLSLSLPKPLGMVLEEVEEGTAAGVFVKEIINEGGGSAAAHEDALLGLKLATVQGRDVTSATFDDAMDAIVSAPDVVDLQFVRLGGDEEKGEGEEEEEESADSSNEKYPIGAPVTIRVRQKDGKPDLDIEAKVGDNLRLTLLENGFEVYQGMKQKLGNCGGGGQCTFCAVDFLDGDGWLERSDYEDKKLAKFPAARLACLNNIQGPATIRKTER